MNNVFAAALICLSPGFSAAAAVPAENTAGFCILGGQSGKQFGDMASLKSVIWKSDIVYSGGAVDTVARQAARLEVLKSMRQARGSKIAVGFDSVSASLQPALDDYAAAKITEEEFLRKAAWRAGGAAGFSFYAPIFDFIRRNKLRALALGVEGELLQKIGRAGLSGLSGEDRQKFPAEVAVSKHKKYLEFLKASFVPAGSDPAAGEAEWNNHLEAVAALNEGAGAKIADFIKANPGWSVLVLTANERIIYNAGVPASVKSRAQNVRQASLYAEDAPACPAVLPAKHKNLANYIWYMPAPVQSATGAAPDPPVGAAK